jgi:hypothetical protein
MLFAVARTFTISESIVYQLNGLIVVFLALGSIWGLLSLTGAWFKKHEKRLAPAAQPAPATQPSAASAANAADTTPPGLIVAITAAVHAACGGRARVVSVSPSATGDWAREGRRQIFSSHKVR